MFDNFETHMHKKTTFRSLLRQLLQSVHTKIDFQRKFIRQVWRRKRCWCEWYWWWLHPFCKRALDNRGFKVSNLSPNGRFPIRKKYDSALRIRVFLSTIPFTLPLLGKTKMTNCWCCFSCEGGKGGKIRCFSIIQRKEGGEWDVWSGRSNQHLLSTL